MEYIFNEAQISERKTLGSTKWEAWYFKEGLRRDNFHNWRWFPKKQIVPIWHRRCEKKVSVRLAALLWTSNTSLEPIKVYGDCSPLDPPHWRSGLCKYPSLIHMHFKYSWRSWILSWVVNMYELHVNAKIILVKFLYFCTSLVFQLKKKNNHWTSWHSWISWQDL